MPLRKTSFTGTLEINGFTAHCVNCTIDYMVRRSFRDGSHTFVYHGPESGWRSWVDETVKKIREARDE